MKNQRPSKLFTLLFIVSTMFLNSRTFAGDVLTAKRDKHYHLSGCPKLEGKQTAVLDEAQAKMKRMRPCPICFKEKSKGDTSP